jgi:hypothetical protein
MVGRALPPGDDYVERRAVNKFEEIISSEFVSDIDPYVLFKKTKVKKQKPAELVSFASASASSGLSRAEGGARWSLYQTVSEIDPAISQRDYRGRMVLASVGNATATGRVPLRVELCADDAMRRYGNPEIFPDDSKEPHRIISVREHGLKVRVLRAAPAVTVAQAHRYRKAYYAELFRHKPTAGPLRGDENDFHVNGAGRGDKRYVYSADFSSASDALAHNVCEEFCRQWDIPLHLIFVPGDKRGLSMGMPMTWTILSFVHLAIARLVDPSESFRIKGDDLIAYWTYSMIRYYRKLVKAVGLILNETKTFTGLSRGVFCEEPWILLKCPGGLRLVKARKGFIPLKWVVKQVEFRPDLVWTGLPTFPELKGRFPLPKVVRLSKMIFGQWIRYAKKLGIDPYAPRALGGLGFPALPEKVASIATRRVATALRNFPFLLNRMRSLSIKSAAQGYLARAAGDISALLDVTCYEYTTLEVAEPLRSNFEQWFEMASARLVEDRAYFTGDNLLIKRIGVRKAMRKFAKGMLSILRLPVVKRIQYGLPWTYRGLENLVNQFAPNAPWLDQGDWPFPRRFDRREERPDAW